MYHLLFFVSVVAVLAMMTSPIVDAAAGCVPNATRILFICHDAGESKGLLPVAQNLVPTHFPSEAVCVLALGQPATDIFAGLPFTASPTSVGIQTPVINGDPGRNQTLPPDDVARFLNFFGGPLIKVVSPGMVYAMQSQLAGALLHRQPPRRREGGGGGGSSSDVVSLAFDDSFALWNASALPGRLFVDPKLHNATEVMTTAESVATAIKKQTKGTLDAYATGTPTLGTWRAIAANTTQKRRTSERAWSDDLAIVRGVVVGGYGPGTEHTLRLICSAALQLGQEAVQWVFSPHPGYSSTQAAKWFKQWGCTPPLMRLIGIGDLRNATDINTAELVVTANFSLSQGSTVGGQAVAVGKPHAYVSTYKDVFAEAGVIPNVLTVSDIVSTVNGTFRQKGYYVTPKNVEAVGIPLDGLNRTLQQILNHF